VLALGGPATSCSTRCSKCSKCCSRRCVGSPLSSTADHFPLRCATSLGPPFHVHMALPSHLSESSFGYGIATQQWSLFLLLLQAEGTEVILARCNTLLETVSTAGPPKAPLAASVAGGPAPTTPHTMMLNLAKAVHDGKT